MRVTMIGAGYVGLVSGACFADFGHHVTCIDKDARRMRALMRGEIPIFEPGLPSSSQPTCVKAGSNFAGELSALVAEADAVFIAVGTPSRRGDGHADLTFVYAAVREIAAAADALTVVVTKSTVPVGTGDEIERILRGTAPDAPMQWCPTRSFCARAPPFSDFKHPDRIVVGTDDARARAVLAELPAALSERGADPLRRAAAPPN